MLIIIIRMYSLCVYSLSGFALRVKYPNWGASISSPTQMFHMYNMNQTFKHQKHVENVSFVNFSFPFVMISKSANSFFPIFKAIFFHKY